MKLTRSILPPPSPFPLKLIREDRASAWLAANGDVALGVELIDWDILNSQEVPYFGLRKKY